jgi:uracil-DNA glycosylase family 4
LKDNATQIENTDWQALNDTIINCRTCPRLVEWREQVAREKRRAYLDWDYWGRPVPGFGDHSARVLVVGLAPGAHGSNRTGRMFTGDSSGATLYSALHRACFANQPIARQRDDGLTLTDAFITAVGRCAPPGNKPTAQELNNCRPFLARELALMPQLEVIVALGQIGFNGCRRVLREAGYDLPPLKFGHSRHYPLEAPTPNGPKHLISCYHPSRQNTQTGRLTQQMLDDVFILARSLLLEAE